MTEELRLTSFEWFLVGMALFGAITFWANACALLIDSAIRRFQRRRQ